MCGPIPDGDEVYEILDNFIFQGKDDTTLVLLPVPERMIEKHEYPENALWVLENPLEDSADRLPPGYTGPFVAVQKQSNGLSRFRYRLCIKNTDRTFKSVPISFESVFVDENEEVRLIYDIPGDKSRIWASCSR